MSYQIKLHELQGDSTNRKLLRFVYEKSHKNKAFLVSPLILGDQVQRGETCKLKALYGAICQQTAKHGFKGFFPLYKQRSYRTSIRQLAKEQGSSVGEMYGAEKVSRLLEAMNLEPGYLAPISEDEYIVSLKRLVENHQAPVVFFDLNITPGQRLGLPRIGDGKNEHAAVVVGYFANAQDETSFIVYNWDKFYVYDGMELALSSFNLPNTREPERFAKAYPKGGYSKWLLQESLATMNLSGDISLFKQRSSRQPGEDHIPLRGKIFAPRLRQKAVKEQGKNLAAGEEVKRSDANRAG